MYFFKVSFSKVYLSKVYSCEMYPTCVSSKLCEFIPPGATSYKSTDEYPMFLRKSSFNIVSQSGDGCSKMFGPPFKDQKVSNKDWTKISASLRHNRGCAWAEQNKIQSWLGAQLRNACHFFWLTVKNQFYPYMVKLDFLK